MRLILLLIFITTISCSNLNKDSVKVAQPVLDNKILENSSYDSISPLNYPDSLRIYIEKANLLSKYCELSESDRKEYEVLFFDEFPSDFKTFEIIYGNVMLEYNLPNILGLKSDEHINDFLFHLSHVDKSDFIRKMIDIGSTGRWDADGVSVFQTNLRDVTTKEVKVVFDLLEERDEKFVEGYFFFLFDGPHPPNELPEEFYALQERYQKIIVLAKKGLRKANEPHPIGR